MTRPESYDDLVATLELTVNTFDDDHEEADFSHLAKQLVELEPELKTELNDAVRRRLGSAYAVRTVRIEEGSIFFFAEIVLVGKVLIAYGALRQALEYLLGDFRRIVGRLVRNRLR